MDESKPSVLDRLKAWSESPPPAPKPRGDKGPTWDERLGSWAARHGVQFAGVSLKSGKLSYRGESQPVTGLRVVVETAGSLQRRATLTRAAAGGLLFGGAGAVVGALLQKKVDTRELYLLVDGERYAWAVPVPASKGAAAREFAAKVNTAAL